MLAGIMHKHRADPQEVSVSVHVCVLTSFSLGNNFFLHSIFIISLKSIILGLRGTICLRGALELLM